MLCCHMISMWFLRETISSNWGNGSRRKWQVCDALRRSGLLARYNDVSNETAEIDISRKAKSLHRGGDRSLEFLILNGECLVSVDYQFVLNTSLPFVHTARRSIWLGCMWNFWTISCYIYRYLNGILNRPTKKKEKA